MIPGGVNLILAGGTEYQIPYSLRFGADNNAYLSRTPASSGNQKTFTMSAWVKRGNLGSAQGIFGSNYNYEFLGFNSSDQINLRAVYPNDFVTTAIFRDPAAWYHVVCAVDTTQATSTDRVKLWINGSQITSWVSTGYPALNATTVDWNTNKNTPIGVQYIVTGPIGYFDGYMAEVNFIDGQALTPSSFGQTDGATGVWVPKKYGGTYGTNGFYLQFADASAASNTAIGKDSSGNQNHWTPSGISVTSGNTFDQMVDSPTLNYPTLSLIDKSAAVVVNRSTLKITGGSAGGGSTFSQTAMTFNLPTTGKWYFEFKRDSVGADANAFGVNITRNYRGGNGWPTTRSSDGLSGYYSFEYGFIISHDVSSNNLTWRNNFIVTGTSVATNSTSSILTTAVYGFAVDCDNSLAYLYENGSLKTNSNGLAFVHPGANAVVSIFKSDHIVSVNFGQQPFVNTPPAGFSALNSKNLPTPTIIKGSTSFDAVTYTGNGSTSNVSITGLNFTSDMLWFKRRDSSTNGDHVIVDSSRLSQLTSANTFISNTGLNWAGDTGNWQWGIDSTGTGVRGGGSLGTNVRTGIYYDVDIDANTSFEVEYQIRGTDSANSLGIVAIYRKEDQGNIGTISNRYALGMFSSSSTHWVGGVDPAPTIGLSFQHLSSPSPAVDVAEEKYANVVTLSSNVATTNVFVLTREADGNLKAYRTNASGTRILIKTHAEKTNSAMRVAIGSQGETTFLGLQYLKINLVGANSTAGRYASQYPNLTTFDKIEEEFVSFNSNGFTIKNNGINAAADGSRITSRLNINTATMVSWAWKKDPSSGFDIVTYTGSGANSNISHSLGVAPSMLIVKQRASNTSTNWAVWHTGIANTNYLLLNSSAASATGATYWNSRTPNSSTFSVGTHLDVNFNNGRYVAYLWSQVEGFSRIGSYTGNGSTDGPFVFCNFRPRFIMIKSAGAENWSVQDSARNSFNAVNARLKPNSSDAEAVSSVQNVDFLSNGFKIRTTDPEKNGSGTTYIFAAFAENPFKYARAR